MKRLHIFRTIIALTLFTLTATPYVAHAQESANTQFKIGVVNIRDVFDNYAKQKKLFEELEAERNELQKPIDALSVTIEADKKRYDSESKTMEESARIALKEKVETDYSEYQIKVKQSQEKIDRHKKSIITEIIGDIQRSVEEVGAQENYHLIFDGTKNTTNSLLYFSTTLNMTQKVIDHLNAK